MKIFKLWFLVFNFIFLISPSFAAEVVKESETKPLSLSLDGAFKEVGFATSVYTFSFWKNAWVLEKGGAIYIVSMQGIKTYQGLSIKIFKFIESSDDGVYFMTYDAKSFEKIRHIFSRYAIKEEKVITIRVPKDAVLDICQYLNNLKFEVSLSQFNLTSAIEIKEIKR